MGLVIIAAAQDVTIPPGRVLSEESQDLLTKPTEFDTTQLREVLQLLQALPMRKFSDLPTMEIATGYGLWIRPCIDHAAPPPPSTYAEQIALLEEALRIAKDLQAKEVRFNRDRTRP